MKSSLDEYQSRYVRHIVTENVAKFTAGRAKAAPPLTEPCWIGEIIGKRSSRRAGRRVSDGGWVVHPHGRAAPRPRGQALPSVGRAGARARVAGADPAAGLRAGPVARPPLPRPRPPGADPGHEPPAR